MKKIITTHLLLIFMALMTSFAIASDEKSYVVMQDDLKLIKADFNDAVNKVRLVFIAGST